MTVAERLRLGNQVVLVEGKYAAALYDLSKGRIQRISLPAASIIRQCEQTGWDKGQLSAPELALIELLLDRRFLERQRLAVAHGFSADWTHSPLFPPLRTLSFAIDEATDKDRLTQIAGLVADAVSQYGLLSVVLVIHAGPAAADAASGLVHALLLIHDQLFVEVHFPSGAAHAHLLLSSVTGVGARLKLITRSAAPAFPGLSPEGRNALSRDFPTAPGVFFANYGYYHLLRNFSESHGCLHFGTDMRVYPDICETDYDIGTFGIDARSLEEVVDNPRLQAYWSTSKDLREKCQDCEFRYACPSPVASRTDPGNLRSAPRSCQYELATGKWPS